MRFLTNDNFNLFNILSLLGGLALFLFGMNIMGETLEKNVGGRFKTSFSKISDSSFKGFFLGLGVTALIQSSSATTVLAVGLVNSGIITLRQSINIIMGANIGTTFTAWILSLTGICGDEWYIKMFKPSSFVSVLAIIGIIFRMFSKKENKRETGITLLGFAILMTGMEIMSESVSGLKNVPEFAGILTLFSNPVLGVLAGAIFTAIIQSSSASVGILQALSSTGQIKFGTAVPIIMGQNIGSCVTALLSSVGTNKNAKRTAFVHLYFNAIGTFVLLILFYAVKYIFNVHYIDDDPMGKFGIALIHSVFNILCTVIWLPFKSVLETLALKTVK